MADGVVDFLRFVRRHVDLVAHIHAAVDLAQIVEDALALNLGRVGSKYRCRQHHVERLDHRLGLNAGLGDALQRQFEVAVLTRRARLAHLPMAPVEVNILGNVGELIEKAEGASHAHGTRGVDAGEQRLQLGLAGLVAIAVKLDRQTANLFDQLKDALTLEIAQRLAEHAPEITDVVAQTRLQFLALAHDHPFP